MNHQAIIYAATALLLALFQAACPGETSADQDAKATLVDSAVNDDAAIVDLDASTDRASPNDTYAPQDSSSFDVFVAPDTHSEDAYTAVDVAVDSNVVIVDAGREDFLVTSDAGSDDSVAHDGHAEDSTSPTPIWTCATEFFNSHDGCDCGCGIVDPDCASPLTLAACTFNFCPSGGVPIATDPTSCALPNGWLCDASLYGDGICDCGCGIVDVIDCADTSVLSCHLCNSYGSCDSAGDCQAINPSNNGLCQ